MSQLGKLTLLVLIAACGPGDSAESSGGAAQDDAGSSGAATATVTSLSDLGTGYIVWESNRSGAWRLWRQTLDADQPQQFVPDEAKRHHCCAHISPDGSWIAYLSIGGPKHEYPGGTVTGELRLISADGKKTRVVGPARVHHENRAAVWRDNQRLLYIDGKGRTVQWTMADDSRQPILNQPVGEYGWLPDPTLTYVTKGREPTFSRLRNQAIVQAAELTGCQPYFTQDGRWGFWTGGGGGPIFRLALDSSSTAKGRRHPEIVIAKNDPRLPEDRRYLYFPMVSRDGRFLTWGASPNEHDHYKADYDIYVAEIDPATLELVGDPIRATEDPATDRYADIFVEPLELGTQRGEAPFTVEWTTLTDGEVSWSFGDGRSGRGGAVSHTYPEPGAYTVTADSEAGTQSGRTLVLPRRPPQLLGWSVPDDRTLALDFDEPIDAAGISVSGVEALSTELASGGRRLLLRLQRPLKDPLQVELEGISDRAQVPNLAATVTVDVDPALWPIEHPSTLLTWTGVGGWNTIRTGAEQEAVEVTRRGTAVPTANGALRTQGGWLEFDSGQTGQLLEALKQTNEFTLELVFRLGEKATGELLSWGQPVPRNSNLSLVLENGALIAHLKAKPTSRGVDRPVKAGQVGSGWHHLAVLFRPGTMTLYLDGEQTAQLGAFQGDFWHWKERVLRIGGNEKGGQLPLEFQGLALHRRELSDDQIADAARRALRAFDQPDVEAWVVGAQRIAATPTPSLREISPYTEGLVTRRYRLADPPAGLPGEVTVVEWAILDGQVLPEPAPNRRLILQRFADQPALEGLFLANDLESDSLYYSPPG